MTLFVLQTPSLLHLAQVKIVADLWTQLDIFTQIERSFNGLDVGELREDGKEWKAIEETVRNKVWALSLPKRCKHQLLNLVKPLGMELIRWCLYHNLDDYTFQLLDNSWLPRQLCWTMHGNVDYAKTAQLMVKDERLDVEKRYILACINCLEDEAGQLIDHIPEKRRLEFVKGGRSLVKREHQSLLAVCTRSLFGCSDVDQFRGDSLNQLLFKTTLFTGNRATCEYFFAKLGPEEKERVLLENPMRSFSCYSTDAESPTCNLMYYLSLMNEEQQERMFRECIYKFLIFLLRWPLQALFAEAAQRGWPLMGKRDCAEVLSAVASKIKNGFKDYDYSLLFWQCWRLSPADYRRHFVDSVYRLEILFATKGREFIKLVLNEAPSHHLNELVENRYERIGEVLTDERVVSDAALMECKQTALLSSSNDGKDEEKRLRSEYVGRLVDLALESRMKRRRNA